MMFENPWLHGLVVGGAVVTLFMTIGALASWWERKFAGRLQNRFGPVIVGPSGVLQPIADVVKMLQKEHLVPRDADPVLFGLAPWGPVFLVLASCAVIPFYGHWVDGEYVSLGAVSDLDVGVLWVLALAGLMVFPIWMAGWSTNNKYALLSAMRMVAQGVSYEIPLVFSAMVPVVAVGSLSLGDIIAYQAEHGWLVYRLGPVGFLAFIIFFLASLAEANRIPFDIPEAESELVGGVLIEYTGIRFGIVLLAEYLHTALASVLAVALFFGGGHGPLPEYLSPIWLALKASVLWTLIYWIRWSWLRYRADQLMALCWNWLVPVTLGLVMTTALMVWQGLV